MTIARLDRVPLREVWKHEAYDFTRWLEENLDVLSEALDRNIDAESGGRERKTESTFSVDLVVKDEGGSLVVIENQLGKSDHDHLGKLITYLAAMEASAAVWIVAAPRPEHIAAVNWLNQLPDADFYLLKIEAVKIAGSPPAALLTLIVGPSEEGKSIGRSKQEMKDSDQRRYSWWLNLVQHPNAELHSHITPNKYSWIGLGSGVRGVGYNYAVTRGNASAEIYIDRGKGADHENLQIFDQLHAEKDQVEQAFGEPLSWERIEGKRACRIRAAIQGGYDDPEHEWRQTQDRMTDAMNRLYKATNSRLRALTINSSARPIEEDSPIG